MRYRDVSEEILYPADELVAVSARDIDELKQRQQRTARKRIRLCAHQDTNEALHEMLIVHTADTYVRPHRHIGKSESYHAIEGCFDLVIFEGNGTVIDVVEFGPSESGRNFFCRLPPELYHGLLIHSDIVVFHETTSGPFSRAQTEFAPWAPGETDVTSGHQFIRQAVRDWKLTSKQ